MTTVTEIRADTNRFRDEIHTLVLRNTKLQREIMTLNTGRERAAAQGAQLTQELTDELNALDEELHHVRAQCHSMRRALDNQRSDADRLGEHMSSETSMSSTRFRRMSSAILGPSGGGGGSKMAPAQESPAPVAERSRGLSIATSALKRRDSVMSRFKNLSGKKMASGGSTPRVTSGDSSSDEDVDIDDTRSVNIDEVSPMPSPGLLSVGSNKSLSLSSTSSTSSSNGSGRPPLRHQSSNNVLHYKASDEKMSTADAHKEHLNNFRRSSRLSRKMEST